MSTTNIAPGFYWIKFASDRTWEIGLVVADGWIMVPGDMELYAISDVVDIAGPLERPE